MQTVTIRLDRVFDVQTEESYQHYERTLFSFESSGRRVLSVWVGGTPDLRSGQTITAVLKRPGDWQSLLGIRIHETGEISRPTIAGNFWMLLLTATVFVVVFMELRYLKPNGLMPAIVVGTLIWLALAHKAMVGLRVHLALCQNSWSNFLRSRWN